MYNNNSNLDGDSYYVFMIYGSYNSLYCIILYYYYYDDDNDDDVDGIKVRFHPFFLCFFRECTSSPGSLCPESAWVRSTWKRRSRQNPRVTVTLWYGLWWPLFSLGGCLEKGQSGWHQLLIYGGFILNRCFHFPSIFFNFNLFRGFQIFHVPSKFGIFRSTSCKRFWNGSNWNCELFSIFSRFRIYSLDWNVTSVCWVVKTPCFAWPFQPVSLFRPGLGRRQLGVDWHRRTPQSFEGDREGWTVLRSCGPENFRSSPSKMGVSPAKSCVYT